MWIMAATSFQINSGELAQGGWLVHRRIITESLRTSVNLDASNRFIALTDECGLDIRQRAERASFALFAQTGATLTPAVDIQCHWSD
jgi:hypothetical protein